MATLQELELSAVQFPFDTIASGHPASTPASTCAGSSRLRCAASASAAPRASWLMDGRLSSLRPSRSGSYVTLT
jgi:hypothetical protein